jgi:F420 biosynthesis protein FbiB-like protein
MHAHDPTSAPAENLAPLDHLLDNNRAWAAAMTAEDPAFFARLAAQQAPELFWIGCSDSRVSANTITGLPPGEVFVHRNVANMVKHADMNCLSAMQFAVDVLKVKHIIVCGHYGCSGVKAALSGQSLGLADNWLTQMQTIADKHQTRLAACDSDTARHDLLCELNVIEQVAHVCQSTVVQAAWRRGQPLSVHGWIYGVHDGLLRDLGISQPVAGTTPRPASALPPPTAIPNPGAGGVTGCGPDCHHAAPRVHRGSERRSVRRYLPQAIEPSVIDRILQAATSAPSAHNRQPWRFAVLNTLAPKQKLAQAMGDRLRRARQADRDNEADIEADVARSQARITGAATVVVVCLSMRDMDRYPDPERSRHEHQMAVQSTAMAGQNLLLAAHDAGLGACWLCAPMFCPDVVRDALQLPADWEPQGLVTLGYPANSGKPFVRKPLAEVTLFLNSEESTC